MKTIIFKGVEFDVYYTYYKAEPMVWNYGDGSGYPGTSESVEINEILHNGVYFTDILEPFFSEIEGMVLGN